METIATAELINLLFVLAVAAAGAGFMAGLLGVGGGIVMVPALYYAFTVLDFDIITRMHLSVGTSLAIIIPTSIISTMTHKEHDAVDFKMVKSFGIFILIGVIAGTFLAVNLKTPSLVLFFSIFAFIVGLFFIFLREKLVNNPKKISDFIKNVTGVIIGFISVPLGIGGGSLMVPALYYAFTVLDFDIVTRMHLSVGTSLAIIIPTSIISTRTHMEYNAGTIIIPPPTPSNPAIKPATAAADARTINKLINSDEFNISI